MCRRPVTTVAVLLLLVVPAIGARKPTQDAARNGLSRSESNAAALPPKDAQWTIYCQAVAGPDHVARAAAFKQQLADSTKMKEWYVIHQDDQSVIYYGFYRTINDPKDKKETERAKADRKTLDALMDEGGNKALTACMFVEVTAPDPEAPPQWNLANALGYWTIEIAMYKEHPQRKQAAIDAVREARAQGVEAYYFHGPTASSVCVGAWPREAVREQQSPEQYNSDPTQDLLVLPQPVSDGAEFHNRQGQRIKALAPRIEPVDPSLLAMMEKYPQRAVNGEVFIRTMEDPITKQKVEIPDPAVLVRIPAPEGPSLLRQNTPPPALVTPISPSQTPGAGKLKSIGQ